VNPLAGIAHMLAHPFVRYAFLAGSAVAPAAGLAGYFLVLRSQVFTADALSHVAVTGAMAALAFGVDPRLGLFVATVAVALGMGVLGPRGRPDDVVVGSVFAWILGLGVLFLSLYTRSRSTSNATAGVTVLFGSVFGLTRGHALEAAAVSAGAVVGLLLIARPLLFATIDEAVARARGLPVTALGLAFLALAGVTAAEATQVVGALLLLGLVAAPAGAAQRLTTRPYRAMWLSALLALAAMWGGLALSYAAPRLPPSFAVIATAAGIYLLAALPAALRRAGLGRAGLGPAVLRRLPAP
jgi:zinc/manganese transport system permease protein